MGGERTCTSVFPKVPEKVEGRPPPDSAAIPSDRGAAAQEVRVSVHAGRRVWLCRCPGASASPAVPAYLPRVNSGEVLPSPLLPLADAFSSSLLLYPPKGKESCSKMRLGWNPGLAQACPQGSTVAACTGPRAGPRPPPVPRPVRARAPKPRYSAWRLDRGCGTVLPSHPQ